MKHPLALIALALGVGIVAGCSKKANVNVATTISVSEVATGAKTKSGKPVDAYEVQLNKGSALILVIGGGKITTSSQALLSLDGQMMEAKIDTLNNQVMIVSKDKPGMIPIPNVTPADAKAKCQPNQSIDLPIDETLAAQPPAPGSF